MTSSMSCGSTARRRTFGRGVSPIRRASSARSMYAESPRRSSTSAATADADLAAIRLEHLDVHARRRPARRARRRGAARARARQAATRADAGPRPRSRWRAACLASDAEDRGRTRRGGPREGGRAPDARPRRAATPGMCGGVPDGRQRAGVVERDGRRPRGGRPRTGAGAPRPSSRS